MSKHSVLITGASSGFGFLISRTLAEKGHLVYAGIRESSTRNQKAAEQFEIVTKQDPNHPFACYGQLASLVVTDPNAAEILGQELVQRWPDNAGFCFEYSKALRSKNKRKEELPVIQKAIELCEDDDVPYQYQRYLANFA